MKAKALREYEISVCGEDGYVEFTIKKGQRWGLTARSTFKVECKRKGIVYIVDELTAEEIFGNKAVFKRERAERITTDSPMRDFYKEFIAETANEAPLFMQFTNRTGHGGDHVIWRKHEVKEQKDADSN